MSAFGEYRWLALLITLIYVYIGECIKAFAFSALLWWGSIGLNLFNKRLYMMWNSKISLLLFVVSFLSLTACKKGESNDVKTDESAVEVAAKSAVTDKTIKIAFVGDPVVDFRDGKSYKTVKIGNQLWMAENVNYLDPKSMDSYCYDNKEENCEKYGRLYKWDAAMKACPKGWHLPSKTDWETLFNLAGGYDGAGQTLKAKSGWNDDDNGADSFGFSLLAAGYRGANEYFYNEGYEAYFWSSTKNSKHLMFSMYVEKGNSYVGSSYNKKYAFSVRCVED